MQDSIVKEETTTKEWVKKSCGWRWYRLPACFLGITIRLVGVNGSKLGGNHLLTRFTIETVSFVILLIDLRPWHSNVYLLVVMMVVDDVLPLSCLCRIISSVVGLGLKS